jgi:hypothetical protein
MNAVFICYRRSKISEFRPIFEGFISRLYTMILSCSLVLIYEHAAFSLCVILDQLLYLHTKHFLSFSL